MIADDEVIWATSTTGEDFQWKPIKGATFVCTLPAALGAVTKLEVKNGKVVATTSSGVPFIVPTGKQS